MYGLKRMSGPHASYGSVWHRNVPGSFAIIRMLHVEHIPELPQQEACIIPKARHIPR